MVDRKLARLGAAVTGLVVCCALCAVLSASRSAARPAAPLVRNGSFEADGTDIKGVGYVVYGNALTGWRVTNALGVGRNTAGGPFVEGRLVPHGANVCVLQNIAAIAQRVGPFRAGKVYRLSLKAMGRPSDGPEFGSIEAEINGTTLIRSARLATVDKGSSYHHRQALFTAGTGPAELTIRQTSGKAGVSVLLDDVRIEEAVPVSGAPVTQVNPAAALTGAMVAAANDLTDVSWVWTGERAGPEGLPPGGARIFRRTFALPARPSRVVVTYTADNDCRVLINGKVAGWCDAFNRLYSADITHLVQAGKNRMEVRATNAGDEPNPAGLILKLVAGLGQSAAPITLVTDARWRWRTEATGSRLRPVKVLAEMGCAPWGWIGPRSARVSRWFPDFIVPGQDRAVGAIRRMFALHAEGGRPACTLWDGWLPLAGLWPVRTRDITDTSGVGAWKQALLSREVGPEGYVATHQHRGFGHSKGWPIPLYMQTGGIGLHFSLANDPFTSWVPHLEEPSDWTPHGMAPGMLDREVGWPLKPTVQEASVDSPRFDIPMAAVPFVRVEWQVVSGKPARAYVQWTTVDRPEFDHARTVEFPALTAAEGMAYSDVPICDSPAWSPDGRMTRLRFGLAGAAGAPIVLKSIITPADTRHNINNPCFIQGSAIYLDWTGDLDFLRRNIARMRKAMAYSVKEFRLRESLCVDMRWFGHDGRGGFERKPDGTRESRWAVGVGNNYWDLLPFGGKDTLATVYHYDALRRMAALERVIAAHPEWRAPPAPSGLGAEDLDDLAGRIKAHAGRLLWNRTTGRFVACIDRDGVAHDYGYTIVNLEAIHYDFATPEQARSILAWLDGRRNVAGDTSTGPDVYRWRFGPRCSTKRNDDWYSGMWEPRNVAFGDQVQDGGGVLGFSYFDVMARLQALGPDDAARRLGAVARWFDEVQAEGGYRAYYARPARGALQGGGPPGGLGLDEEFVESVLVPQVMVYGFLGFRPGLEGFSITPRLPKAWPSLEITRVRYRGLVIDVKADRRSVTITTRGGQATGPVRLIGTPPQWTVTVRDGAKRIRKAMPSGSGWLVPTTLGTTLEVRAP